MAERRNLPRKVRDPANEYEASLAYQVQLLNFLFHKWVI